MFLHTWWLTHVKLISISAPYSNSKFAIKAPFPVKSWEYSKSIFNQSTSAIQKIDQQVLTLYIIKYQKTRSWQKKNKFQLFDEASGLQGEFSITRKIRCKLPIYKNTFILCPKSPNQVIFQFHKNNNWCLEIIEMKLKRLIKKIKSKQV